MSAAAALALLALAGWAGWRIWGGHPPAPRGLALARRELATLAAAADAIFPRGGPLEPSGADAGVGEWVDRFAAAAPAGQRRLMRLLFFAVEHATLVFPVARGPRGLRRFSAQPPDVRAAWLEQWRTSRLFARRLAFTSLRALVTLGYFADPVVLRALGLAPRAIETPVCEADLLYPPVGQPRAAVRYTRADVSPPSDGVPIAPGDPLHPAYAERAR